MQILVTGGNGFVGRHVVEALLARGDRVRVLALPGEDASRLEERGAAVHRGDVRRPETLLAPMAGVDGVLHLAAMMDVWRPLGDYRAVNVHGTLNVCAAALRAGVGRLVHMSSTSVYGLRLGRSADEGFPLRPFPDPYPLTKAEGDLQVQRMIAEEGLPAAIVRPDQIIGPGDRLHFGRMADRLAAGRAVVVGRGDNLLPLVDVADAVQGLLLALDHERALGRAFNITHDQPLTQAELLHAIAGAIGAPPPRLRVPYRVLYAAGGAAERLAGLTGGRGRPPITRFGVAFVGSESRHAIARARRELGYRPRTPLRESVRRAAAWYLCEAHRDPRRSRSAAKAPR